jgi:predicted RND superfamily exporter protein
MLGFGVMLFSSFVPVRRFGTLIGVTVFGTLIATVIVLPAMLKVAWSPERAAKLSDDLHR